MKIAAECFEEGKLKKTKKEAEHVKNSVEQAEHYLGRAVGVLKSGFPDVSFLMSYNAMFHAARALLFRDGVKERSHYCMIQYLREEYSRQELSQSIEILDNYRLDRHKVQYSGGNCTPEEAEQAIKDAREFITLVKKEVQ